MRGVQAGFRRVSPFTMGKTMGSRVGPMRQMAPNMTPRIAPHMVAQGRRWRTYKPQESVKFEDWPEEEKKGPPPKIVLDDDEAFKIEPWMWADPRIKRQGRTAAELAWMPFPEDDEEQRKYVSEFMRDGPAFVAEQARIRAVKPELYGVLRQEMGNKEASEKYRKDNMLTSLIFGRTKNHKYAPLPIAISTGQIIRQMRHHGISFGVTIFRMHLEGRRHPILVKPCQVQFRRESIKLMNITFMRWSPYKRTRITLPIEVIGERDCIGAKKGGAILKPTKGVECIYDGPGPLPRKFTFNVQNWDINERVYVSDLEMPAHTKLRFPNKAHSQVLVTIKKT
ncbi:hypothetical protein AAMO2058_001336400 [Amorphochlora amoebiformis]